MQYTWSVPQDLAALASLMGGDAAATRQARDVHELAQRDPERPLRLVGQRAERVGAVGVRLLRARRPIPKRSVRSIVDTEYADAPVDEPGNDDLGAISSWYVWAALGLFPVTPGSANLALASPLFPSVTHHPAGRPPPRRGRPGGGGLTALRPRPDGDRRDAPGLPSRLCGRCPSAPAPHAGTWSMPWLPASVLQTGGTLDDTSSSSPDPAWGSSPADSPPRSAPRALPAVGFSSPSGARPWSWGSPRPVSSG